MARTKFAIKSKWRWLIYYWSGTRRHEWWHWWHNFAANLWPHPNTGKIGLDIIWIFLVCVLQFSVTPFFSANLLYIDLLSSWLGVLMIRQTFWHGVVFALLSAYLTETHLGAPRGTYFCIYGVSLAMITNIKSPFSWTHQMPWLVSIMLVNAWVIVMELITLGLSADAVELMGWSSFFLILLRYTVSCLFGFFLAQNEMLRVNT